MSNAVTYDVVREYLSNPEANTPAHGFSLSTSPGWCLAVIRLGRPVTYSRQHTRSVGNITTGAFERKEKPLIISDECIQLTISRPGSTHIKTLNAVLKSAKNNYLSANAILPNDWLFAWCHNDIEKTRSIIKDVLDGRPANDFMSGLKFVGRVNSIRKRTAIEGVNRITTYTLQGVGFRELEAEFYYDVRVASMAKQGGEHTLALFLSELNLEWQKIVGEMYENRGDLKDNMGYLIPKFIDIVIGSGAKGAEMQTDQLDGGIRNGKLVQDGPKVEQTFKQLRDAPYAYMIPVTVASILGKTPFDKTKNQPGSPTVYGYSDILHLLIGVQQFSGQTTDLTKGFWPVLNFDKNSRNIPISNDNRSYCKQPVKGTYLPQEGDFINKPIWSILQQFLNQAVNQMYTALRVTPSGSILPTIIVRQIPFTTSAWPDTEGFPVTRFLDLPRWKIDPVLVKYIDVGRSDGTHANIVALHPDTHLEIQPRMVSEASWNATMNPVVYDAIDIGRSGIRSSMQVINCTVGDAIETVNGIRVWEELVADRMFGSQFALNGQILCQGIQSPIAECDNIELEGIVYNIESITDTCQITEKGKTFNTLLQVTNGMPADQGDSNKDFPRYPGFQIIQDKSEEEYKKFAEEFEKQTGIEAPEKTNVIDSEKTYDETTGYDEEMTSLDPQMNEAS